MDEALSLIYERRELARPNMGFVLCLRRMEREINGEGKDDGGDGGTE